MEIECVFDKNNWRLTTPQNVYTCTVTSCEITTRNSAIATFKGDHERSKNNSDVKGLSFEETTVYYIPKNLSTIFPNLVFLMIKDCGLKEVSAADMIGLGKLEVFWAYDNEITTLPVDLFKKMPNLKDVSFNSNRIQKFAAKILEPIKDTIKVFGVLENPGIDKFYDKNSHKIEHFIESSENSTRLENLYTSSKHSDFTIKVQEKEYRVHKCILASMSPFFDRMFSTDASLTSRTFENIRNFSHEVIDEFLGFFYSRATPSEENVKDSLLLSIEFDVPDLKLRCENMLADTISPENSLDLYNLAVRHSLEVLKRQAFEAIQELHPEIPDYLIDEPEVIRVNIEAKIKHQAKKIKLEKEE